MNEKEKTYFPELDGLRFFAFLLVFIHHGEEISSKPYWLTLREYGWMGVDLFLCLSAFLFTKLLYTEYQRTGTINIPYFYVRRTLRIWPLYYVVTFALILETFSLLGSSGLAWRTIGMLTFTDNLLTAAFLTYNPFLYASHLWTIAYEEQFYAVIPWALRYIFKVGLRTKVLIMVAMIGLGSVIRAGFIWMQVPHPTIWVLPITHFDSILIGLMIGLGILDPILNKIPASITWLAGLAALAVVCKLPNVDSITWYLMLTYPLVGIGMGLILYTVLHSSNSRWVFWVSSQPLSFLGKISYGLYVYHKFGLRYIGNLLVVDRVNNYWLWFLSVFILPLLFTIVVSALSYYILEKPFLRMKDRFSIVLSRPV